VYLSGLREKYFGEIFLNGSEYSLQNKFRLEGAIYEEGLNHIARYVESFESRSNEIWLVFSYEGVSLSKLLYTVEDANSTAEKERLGQVKQVRILRPSKWWRWLKTTEEGQEEMRKLIWQLVCLQFMYVRGNFCYPCSSLIYNMYFETYNNTTTFPPRKDSSKLSCFFLSLL
jgi:hypothetical protein